MGSSPKSATCLHWSALFLAASLAACGTTVPNAAGGSDGTLGSTAGTEHSAGTMPTGQQDTLAPGTGSRSSDGPLGSGTSQPAVGGGSVPGSAPATSARTRNLGPGVDDKSINIGLTVQQNNATASSLASTYNVTLPDNRRAYAALVSYVNAHGGVGGRKLRPTYYSYDPTSMNAGQLGQAACAALTEDANVFAAIDTLETDTLNACLQRRGRVMLPYGLYFGGNAKWTRYSNVVAADGLPFERAGTILAQHLATSGFLTKSTRLGALVGSNADLTAAYRDGLVPALAKFGLIVKATQFIRNPQDASGISGYTTDISSAVLKFSSSGIDRVVFIDTGSYAAMVFAQNAESQRYRPRYGFSSLNSVVALQGEGSAAPQRQMAGAVGVSWETNADGLATARTPSARQCLAILKQAGIVATDAGSEGSYLKTCQTFFLFKAAAEAAGPNLNRDTFIGAAERLGTKFASTNTWNGMTRFGVHDHSGVSVYRPFVYRDSCSCFTVSGGIQPVDAR